MHVAEGGFRPADFPRPAAGVRRAPAPRAEAPPSPGESRQFWVWDTSVMPPQNRRVNATARAVSPDVSIFVEDSLWGRTVGDREVETIRHRFLEQGPAGSSDPGKSLFDVSTDYFGRPPTAPNGSDHTVLLVTDLPSFQGTTLDGYVNPFDQMTDEEASRYGQRSNEANLVYLNGNGRSGVATDYMQGVLAHEFQHLTHHRHDPEEESWLNEMVSQASMLANGYHTDMGHVARFARHPDRPLVSETYVDYGAELLFAEFLMERYGKGFYQDLVRRPEHGTASVDAVLRDLGRPERFGDLYGDWLVANYADSRGTAEPGRHYARLDLPPMAEGAALQADPVRESVSPTGGRYHRIATEGSARVRVEGPEGLLVRAMRFDGPRLEVRTLQPSGDPVALEPGEWVLAVGNLGREKADYTLRRVD